MPFRLYTTAYQEPDAPRRAEFEECLRMNELAFHEVVVMAEDLPRPSYFRGRWFEGIARQRYADLASLAATTKESDVVVIANADIVFHSDTLAKIDANIQPHQAYALTRWDVIDSDHAELFNYKGIGRSSQDSWVFRGPPRQSIGGDYPFGFPGVDNRFAHELDAAGYQVLNPSKSIQTFHLHKSGVRNGNKPENRVPRPYLFVEPHALGQQPRHHRPFRISNHASQFRKV